MLAGLRPAARRLLTFPSKSNQNGAPNVTATAVSNHPSTNTGHFQPSGRFGSSQPTGNASSSSRSSASGPLTSSVWVLELDNEALAEAVVLPEMIGHVEGAGVDGDGQPETDHEQGDLRPALVPARDPLHTSVEPPLHSRVELGRVAFSRPPDRRQRIPEVLVLDSVEPRIDPCSDLLDWNRVLRRYLRCLQQARDVEERVPKRPRREVRRLRIVLADAADQSVLVERLNDGGSCSSVAVEPAVSGTPSLLVEPVRRLRIPFSRFLARTFQMPAMASFTADATMLKRKKRNESPMTTSTITQSIAPPAPAHDTSPIRTRHMRSGRRPRLTGS